MGCPALGSLRAATSTSLESRLAISPKLSSRHQTRARRIEHRKTCLINLGFYVSRHHIRLTETSKDNRGGFRNGSTTRRANGFRLVLRNNHFEDLGPHCRGDGSISPALRPVRREAAGETSTKSDGRQIGGSARTVQARKKSAGASTPRPAHHPHTRSVSVLWRARCAARCPAFAAVAILQCNINVLKLRFSSNKIPGRKS